MGLGREMYKDQEIVLNRANVENKLDRDNQESTLGVSRHFDRWREFSRLNSALKQMEMCWKLMLDFDRND